MPLEDLQLPGGRKTAFDIDIESLEEKPWRKPGIDISDYFNYGFDESSWKVDLYTYKVDFIFARGMV